MAGYSAVSAAKAVIPRSLKQPLKRTLIRLGAWPAGQIDAPQTVVSESSALIAHKTQDPHHPAYDVVLAGNYPGTFSSLSRHTVRTAVSAAHPMLRRILDTKSLHSATSKRADPDFLYPEFSFFARELANDPNYLEFCANLKELEDFVSNLNRKGPGQYFHGGVSLEDAAFLYWLVRMLNPQKVVQTGTSNGVSCGFITLALARNGQGGRLFAIDIPQVYDAANPEWTQAKTYGVLIPPGKSSAWLVPSKLKSSIEVWQGDAKELLPRMIEKVGAFELFFHDSDHTYPHMWFEFEQALRGIASPGLMVADDIAWGPVLWEFAESIGCHSFNHRGSQGLLFL